ncbi:TOTE conflict system archaeo-eukaryotic primase domain-containing protein [Litchfieldia alkalitelluris]|uniref:TOTE conflict system archaeo-eukaryotic primase domain-containing protein n=1 Tax=Litchfieldia alkalitelluris TaxID=304268 RepID=UPI0009975FCC|nr:DEAD/DEAH box helicase [Litchfieldia alkalitelluris]
MNENTELILNKVLVELEKYKEENEKLKNLLIQHNIQFEQEKPIMQSNKSEMIRQRINIFKNLFKGRTDVYSVRWESKSGRSGYMPACENEWVPNICEKPNIKCSACSHKKYLELTDKVLYEHLSGKKTIGVYPLLKDETCYFLALDFDKKSWKEDASAFYKTCKEYNVPSFIEISRSGNGCHIWIFFDQAIPAVKARKLGSCLLTKTMESRYQIGLDSYDRMFPNQDILPEGGFGNLIALPLQKVPREKGNSIFVDSNFEPINDQWGYLANIEKFNKTNVEQTISTLSDSSQGLPSINITLPKKITIELKIGVEIQKSSLPSSIAKELIELTSFSNPEYYKAQSRRLSTHGIPRVINCSYEDETNFIFPRGCFEDIISLFNKYSIENEIKDYRYKGNIIEADFTGTLFPEQQEAVDKLCEQDTGVLSATTGFGKTVVGAALIGERNVNTLVIVHRKQLMEQWKESLNAFLKLGEVNVGLIGGGKSKPSGCVDIATIQTLTSRNENMNLLKNYGQIIVDECHHISAFTFENVLKKSSAKYIHGLTATPTRKDGLHPIMRMQCGPIRYKVTAKRQSKVHTFDHQLIPRYTKFKSEFDEDNKTIQKIYGELSKSEKRNDLIFDDVLRALDEGRNPIILTERQEHVDLLESKLKGFAKNLIVLTGGVKKKDVNYRLKKLKEVPEDEERLIIATGKYIGEGFDDSRLDTLFLTMPVSWKGTLQQYIGRLHRSYENKEIVQVYDYVDSNEPILQRMFEKRKEGYKSLGYKINLDASYDQMKLF